MNKFDILFSFLAAWRTQKFSKLKVNILKFVRGSWCVANNCEEFAIWRKNSSPYSGIEKFHLRKEWFGLFLIFRYEILYVTETFLLNKVGCHIESIVKGGLEFLLFWKGFILKQMFDETVYHVVNNWLVHGDLTFIEFELLRKGHVHVVHIENSRTCKCSSVNHIILIFFNKDRIYKFSIFLLRNLFNNWNIKEFFDVTNLFY